MTACALEPSERYDLSAGGFAVAASLPDAVAELLAACLPGWRLAPDGGRGAPAEISVEAEAEGFLVRNRLLAGGRFAAGTALEAANAVAGAATGAWLRARPDWVQLHAAAVLLGERLTLLLGASGAGKSTLALECAAAGHRLFGDDRLAVALPDGPGAPEGVALGVGPKLRRPLPAEASPALRRLAEERALHSAEAVDFLALPAAALAAPGERAPIGRLVLLERADGAAAELRPAEAAAVLRALLPNALAPGAGPEALLDWARRLAERLPCRRLRYGAAGEARALLEAEAR